MNKNKAVETVDNFLKAKSLFDSSQKNKLVSPYISYRNYTESITPKKNIKTLDLPNSKKDHVTYLKELERKKNQKNITDLSVRKLSSQKAETIKQNQIKSHKDPNQEIAQQTEETVQRQLHDIAQINKTQQNQNKTKKSTKFGHILISELDQNYKDKQQIKKPNVGLQKIKSDSFEHILNNSNDVNIQAFENYRLNSSQTKDFTYTRIQIQNYLEKIKKKLNDGYHFLAQIETNVSNMITKSLQLQCQKIRNNFYRIIDKQIEHFFRYQKSHLSQKMIYMANLFEVKDMISHRIEELQHYKQTIKEDEGWRMAASAVIVPDYENCLEQLIAKVSQIQEEKMQQVSLYLAKLENELAESIIIPGRKQFEKAIEQLFYSFYQNRKMNLNKRNYFNHKKEKIDE